MLFRSARNEALAPTDGAEDRIVLLKGESSQRGFERLDCRKQRTKSVGPQAVFTIADSSALESRSTSSYILNASCKKFLARSVWNSSAAKMLGQGIPEHQSA